MRILQKMYYAIAFLVFYLIKLVQSNLYIAYDILTPQMHTNPCLIKVPLTITSDMGLLLFCNLLSMTPGTLSIDMTEDKKYLWVHVLYKKSELEMLVEMQKMQDKIIKISD